MLAVMLVASGLAGADSFEVGCEAEGGTCKKDVVSSYEYEDNDIEEFVEIRLSKG